jgi:hypothetical protein
MDMQTGEQLELCVVRLRDDGRLSSGADIRSMTGIAQLEQLPLRYT